MSRTDHFAVGREQYLKKEYELAADSFLLSITKDYCSASCAWLGSCYEYGLGVEKDLIMAKDLYLVCQRSMGVSSGDGLVAWLLERLKALECVEESKSMSRFIEGIGNVKVIKNLNGPESPQLRYNKDEVVVNTDKRHSFVEAFCFARQRIPEINAMWTCDGVDRFYDGYALETDFFSLKVKRGETDSYITRIDGYDCTVVFPRNADPDYLYVQETIRSKVKDVLYKRAKTVIPPVLQRVSKQIKVPYEKCFVVRSLKGCSAYNLGRGREITISACCIQLPVKSLEALCIHELTHNFVLNHGKEFHDKMRELGGEEYHALSQNLWNEGRWRYLNM